MPFSCPLTNTDTVHHMCRLAGSVTASSLDNLSVVVKQNNVVIPIHDWLPHWHRNIYFRPLFSGNSDNFMGSHYIISFYSASIVKNWRERYHRENSRIGWLVDSRGFPLGVDCIYGSCFDQQEFQFTKLHSLGSGSGKRLCHTQCVIF